MSQREHSGIKASNYRAICEYPAYAKGSAKTICRAVVFRVVLRCDRTHCRSHGGWSECSRWLWLVRGRESAVWANVNMCLRTLKPNRCISTLRHYNKPTRNDLKDEKFTSWVKFLASQNRVGKWRLYCLIIHKNSNNLNILKAETIMFTYLKY